MKNKTLITLALLSLCTLFIQGCSNTRLFDGIDRNCPAASKDQLNKNVQSDEKLDQLFQSLKEINAKLWVIEDDKRLCEKNSDFGEKFTKLSRDVHFLNDDRAKIKLEINNHTGSKIKEIKEYTNY